MAPPKTMAISQQQQQQAACGVGGGGDMKQNTSVKPRKRKGKQQHQSNTAAAAAADHVQKTANTPATATATATTTNNKHESVVAGPQLVKAGVSELAAKSASNSTPAVVPIERTTINKSQNKQQEAKGPATVSATATTKRQENSSNGVRRAVQAVTATSEVPSVIGKHKQQLVSEEADDIDAGIELDGSSNSGSSVKDIGEDQKSASVSPVMAPQQTTSSSSSSSVAFERSTHEKNVNQQTAEISPIEKLDGSVCTAAKPVQLTAAAAAASATPAATTTEEPQKVKKSSSLATKQQLAANQQVIDADERQLQQRLQNKQKKLVSQDSGASLDDSSNGSPVLENIDPIVGLKKAQKDGQPLQTDVTNSTATKTNDTKTTTARAAGAAAKPRRFSSQSSQEQVDASCCRVCGQHVYQMEKMLAEKSIYHKRCFRCYQCKIQLRVDNYSSHEGQVYCKAHHRQIFQPQVKLDNSNDVDIVAKSTTSTVDDYLLHRGRLSELSFSFLQPKPQELLKRQMIICENEPAELPKDVVRSDTKLDDGIDNLKLNLNNILERFERGTTSGEDSTPSTAGMLIDKPSFNIKKTLMAFESKSSNEPEERSNERATERPVVKKLTNLNGFFNHRPSNNSQEKEETSAPSKPLPVKRSESLMLRLKKYESRIAGEQVEDDDDDADDSADDENNNSTDESKTNKSSSSAARHSRAKVGSINLSSLKNQWENGEISRKRSVDDEDGSAVDGLAAAAAGGDKNGDGDELIRIRQQLVARKKSGDATSVKNIYENAIKEAQLQQQQQASRRESSDLSALNGFSTTNIQQKLLQRTSENNSQTKTTPNRDHFQLNLSNRANKLKERFELGLINNDSRDDSDQSENEDGEAPISKLEQIRQEKLEDLSIFTEGEIKAREARSMFEQIDRRISAANGGGRPSVVNTKSLASVQDAMRSKLTSRMTASTAKTQPNSQQPSHENNHHQDQQLENRPIRLTNNVRI